MTPAREAFDAATRALDARDWREFTRWLHPEALERFRASQLGLARTMATPREMPAEGEDATSLGARLERARLVSLGFLLERTYRVATVEELARLPAEEMVVRTLESRDPERSYVEWVRAGRPGEDEGADFTPPRIRREYVGEVADGAEAVHVVFRLTLDGADGRARSRVLLIELRATPGGWGLMLDEARGDVLLGGLTDAFVLMEPAGGG
ncbi:MAG TPA: hypothetical protein VFQ38_06730 [Longimicrobiales bacterium]|nr:hypothetical protein [Longimicrobiales bacterium]